MHEREHVGPQLILKTHGDEKMYLIEVTFVIPNAAHVYSDSQIAFTGS